MKEHAKMQLKRLEEKRASEKNATVDRLIAFAKIESFYKSYL